MAITKRPRTWRNTKRKIQRQQSFGSTKLLFYGTPCLHASNFRATVKHLSDAVGLRFALQSGTVGPCIPHMSDGLKFRLWKHV